MTRTTKTRRLDFARGSAENRHAGMFIVSEREGLQLHRGRNLFQLAALIAFAAVGAVIGGFATDDRADLAAMAGGMLGMIAGTFLSGLVLMFLPPPATTMTLDQIRTKHRQLIRRFIISAIVYASFMLTFPLIISRFGHEDSTLAWAMCLLWICATTGLCVYTRLFAHRLRKSKCPVCGKPFGKLSWLCRNCERRDATWFG